MHALPDATTTITAWAPGRVNLIGEHTDYTGGLALPMAVQMGTTVTARALAGRLRLSSSSTDGVLDLALGSLDPSEVTPSWGRYVAGVASALSATVGLHGTIESDLPLGGGLSSSASLEVAVALALLAADPSRAPLDVVGLATACQRAEQLASGVPCGVMDQLASAGGVAGHALRIDCTSLTVTPVEIPPAAQVLIVDSGQQRTLAGSEYALRRRQCEDAEREIGPLRDATTSDLRGLADATLRARARHVVTENRRVDAFADALVHDDLRRAGGLMVASHASLRDDFEVSTPILDELVDELTTIDGVYGARLTGAGFGGCVVALTAPGVEAPVGARRSWVVTASAGAWVRSTAD